MKKLYRKHFIIRLLGFPLSLLFTVIDIILVAFIYLLSDIDELFLGKGKARLKISFINFCYYYLIKQDLEEELQGFKEENKK